jgi:hypothetical protein
MQRRCCSWAWFGDADHWSCSDDGEPAGTVRPLRLTACNAQRAAAVGRRRGPPHSQAQALQKNVLGSYRRRADQFSARSSGSSSTSLPCAWQVSVQPASLYLVRCTRYASYDVGFALYVAWRAACCRVRFGRPATPHCGACGDCRAEGVARTGLLPRVQKRWFGGAKLGAGNPQSAIDTLKLRCLPLLNSRLILLRMSSIRK